MRINIALHLGSFIFCPSVVSFCLFCYIQEEKTYMVPYHGPFLVSWFSVTTLYILTPEDLELETTDEGEYEVSVFLGLGENPYF